MTKITAENDLALKDWAECRATIGRLDGILVDLRKVGFSFITALLTAGSFLGWSASSRSVPVDVSSAVFGAVMVLVVALYCVDTNFVVLLHGAVQRAREIEAQTDPPIRVTEYLYLNATRAKVNYVTLGLYLVLLFTAESFALLATRSTLDAAALWSLPSLYWVFYVGIVVTILGSILARITHWKIRRVEGAIVGLWLLWSVTAVLATSMTGNGTHVALQVLIAGAILASFVGLYWLYVDNKVGLSPLRAVQNRVYLAGPDVFFPDSARVFARYAEICNALQLKAVLPADTALSNAPAIYKGNVERIESCGGVIANITPFRGPHCDVGTAFEVGYAAKHGIPVWAYSDDSQELIQRIEVQVTTDQKGFIVEDFGLNENLMIVRALKDAKVHPDFESAAAAAAKTLLSS